MMSSYSANPIFFNKKIKDWMSRTLAPSDNISFLPYPLPPFSPQSGRYMCITP